MKRILPVLIFTVFTFQHLSAQLADYIFKEGKAIPVNTSNSDKNTVPKKIGNGNSTLGLTYLRENACGLNFAEASQLVETRSIPQGFNTNGTGNPTSLTFSTLCAANDSIVEAYLYWEASYTEATPPVTSATLTNPLLVVNTYAGTLIGQAGSKCWGEKGTASYRTDVTAAIAGNGVYTIDLNGFANAAYEVDGVTMIIIYRDPTATYSGSIALYDGEITASPGTSDETFTGFNVCAATSTASAFSLLADMQSNENGNSNTETFNGTTGTFTNDFWNFADISTTLTAGQNNTTYDTYTNNAGDCYAWVLGGLYWQNTTCVTCIPASSFIQITTSGDTICQGDSVAFTASGANSYTWSPTTGLSCPTCVTTYAAPAVTTVYTVSGTDACGIGTATLTLTVKPKPLITISPANPGYCVGDSVQITASGATTYSWSPSAGLSCTSCPNPVASPTITTTYSLTAINSCGTKDTTVTVNVSIPPIATLSPNNDSICSGDSVALTAGGGGTYLWNTGATTSTIKVGPLSTSSYTVHVFSSPSCQDSTVTSIHVTESITSAVNLATDSICPGSSTVLSVTSSGGPPAYNWSTGATTSSITVNPISTTTYYVLVSGKCAGDSIPMQVTVIPFPVLNITAPDTVCRGSNASLNVSGATNYLWSNGITSSTNMVTINSDTSFTVIGTNGHCSDSLQRKINIYPKLKALSSNDSICAGGKSAVVQVEISGGKTAYTYSWNNGITWDSAGPFNVIPPPDQYICTISDGCGDVIMDTVNILVRQGPAVSFFPTPDTILGGGFVNFVNNTSGATNYYWNLGDGTTTSDTTPFHEYNQAGTYIVELIATNSFGCIDTLTEDVYVTEKIVVPNVFTPNGDGINDVFHITAGSMQTYDIQIYNRWGQKIFESQSPNIDWTGRSSSGELEATGTYYYIITATDYVGKSYNFDGYVELIR